MSRTGRKRARRPDAGAIIMRRLQFVAVLAVLVLLVIWDRGGFRAAPSTDAERYDGVQVRVTRVIDGDTIVIDLPDATNDGKPTRVRLWGIDTPELARFGKPADPFAEEAKAFAAQTLTGRIVKLTIEPHSVRDRFGRLLAHVELENGDQFAIAILEAGLAHAEDRWPHRWSDWFASAELQAKREKVGMWAE